MKPKNQHDILSISSFKKNKNKNELINILLKKLFHIQEIIRNTILSIKRNKLEEIFSNNDSTLSTSILVELYDKTDIIHKTITTTTDYNTDDIIVSLQKVIDKLSMIICGFGTTHIVDLLFISFGSEFQNTQAPNNILQSKYELIKKFVRPIGYKIIHWKKTKNKHIHKNILCENKITEENIVYESLFCIHENARSRRKQYI